MLQRRTATRCSGGLAKPTAATGGLRYVFPPRRVPPDEHGDPSNQFYEAAPRSSSAAPSGGGMYFPPTKELAEWRYALPALVFAAGGMPIFHIPPDGPLLAAGVAGLACSLGLRREGPAQVATYVVDAPALLVRDTLAFTIGPAAGVICLVAFAWEPSIAALLGLLRICRVPLGTGGAKEPMELKYAVAAWVALFTAFVLKWTLFEAVEPDEAAELEAARGRLAAAAAAGGMDARLLGRVSQPADPPPADEKACAEEPPEQPPGVFRPRSEHAAPADGSERHIPTHGRLVPAEIPPHLKDHLRGGGGKP